MIQDILPRYQEVATGSKTAFTFPFDVIKQEFIEVYLGTTKVTTGWTLSEKTITFTTAPENGVVVTIYRNIPIEWVETNLGNLGQLGIENINTYIVAQIQAIEEGLSRAIQTRITDTDKGEDISDDYLNSLEQATSLYGQCETLLEEIESTGEGDLEDMAEILQEVKDYRDEVIGMISTDTNLGNSDSVVPSQKAVKTYVDNGLSAKANDSAVVHLSETETITGYKYFNSQIHLSAGNGAAFAGTNHYYVLRSSGSPYEGCSLFLDNDTSKSAFAAGVDKITIGSANIPGHSTTPSTSDNSTRIATTAFVKAQGYATSASLTSSYVDLTSTQDVGGTKTFTANYVGIKNLNATRGTVPSGSNRDFTLRFRDSTGDYTGGIYQRFTTGGDSYVLIQSYKNEATSHSHVCGLYLRYYSDNTKSIYPEQTSTTLGTSSLRWSVVYAASSNITTSDENKKQNIETIPDAVLDAWGDVQFYQFKFRDSVAEKGENARTHTGVIAQRIKTVFENHNLDATKYGLLCYDEWEAQPAEVDENGDVVTPARAAGNIYSIRYEECLCMEAAYQRRRADRIEERLRRLEERL